MAPSVLETSTAGFIPTKNKGLGAGQASSLCWVEACARQVALAFDHTILVGKSMMEVATESAGTEYEVNIHFSSDFKRCDEE